jgi:hypothetical protein
VGQAVRDGPPACHRAICLDLPIGPFTTPFLVDGFVVHVVMWDRELAQVIL